MPSFESLQRAYDERLPPEYEEIPESIIEEYMAAATKQFIEMRCDEIWALAAKMAGEEEARRERTRFD